MLQIPIDDERYHSNRLTEKERTWAWKTYCRITNRYQNLPSLVEKTLADLHYSSQQKQRLLTDVTLAFAHYAKVTASPKTESELDATLKKCFCNFLSYIAENVACIRASHPVQYEPIALTNLYVSNTLQTALENFSLSADPDPFTFYFLFDLVALFRSIRSLTFLLTLGDDAHGMGLLRGVLEIISKLTLANTFPEEYALFKEFNAYLQEFKNNKTPLPIEMTEYLKGEKSFAKSQENFLAYGWAKNKKGKRILTLREFLSAAIENDDVSKIFQISSEFVHEDYAAGYDYIAIRKYLLDCCFFLHQLIFDENLLVDVAPNSAYRKAKHLLQLAKPYYHGEF